MEDKLLKLFKTRRVFFVVADAAGLKTSMTFQVRVPEVVKPKLLKRLNQGKATKVYRGSLTDSSPRVSHGRTTSFEISFGVG